PQALVPRSDIPVLLDMPFVARSAVILDHLTQGEIDPAVLRGMVKAAFNFKVPLVKIGERTHALELFHGTSLAFKDFGARFMAEVLAWANRESGTRNRNTILTATSGDTGAAVAQAFYRQQGIDVVILYPKGRVSGLQEKLFCTLGENIRTLAVEDDFDACQALVKQAFDDPELVRSLGLNSANSINIARLLAQVCYYFEAVAQLPRGARPVFSVPSGNFGNVTAGLIACAIGLPAKRIIAATNSNDTVPRFIATGEWDPRPTVATMTNAMDISKPNNFSRVLALHAMYGLDVESLLVSSALDDDATAQAIRDLEKLGYLADPHSALGWRVLADQLNPDETGVFLCTAHPAKFREHIEAVTGKPVELPAALAKVADKKILSQTISSDFQELRSQLLQ
ncbi:MAG: threonine synthase, partial [Xanthomonadales bacterium]|nr:threonine synthase [Xanthomonadales bacterium]